MREGCALPRRYAIGHRIYTSGGKTAAAWSLIYRRISFYLITFSSVLDAGFFYNDIYSAVFEVTSVLVFILVVAILR